jgi:polysaccharide export outer membrane protein
MILNILFLMLAGMLGVFSPAILWAEDGEAAHPQMPLGSEGKVFAPDAVLPSAKASAEENYLIGPGDVLDIAVWKDEALTRSCTVRPDGIISFPLIGEIQAAGRTTVKLKEEMEKKLERYVPEGNLSVDVKQVNSLLIYVIGRVNAPGRFVMNANVDVLQALATAGGLNVYAKRNRIKIYRHEKNGTTIFPFEYDEVVDGKRLEQNVRLKRGDVVVIP